MILAPEAACYIFEVAAPLLSVFASVSSEQPGVCLPCLRGGDRSEAPPGGSDHASSPVVAARILVQDENKCRGMG